MTMTPEEEPAMANERAFLLGQMSVDIEIALYQAGVTLTEAQGYIAAEAVVARMQERVRAETDWQDIATAPKDGSFIDIWFAPQTDTGKDLIACRVPNCSWEDGNWYTDRNVRIWGRVTHWRPLPPPPAIRETPHAEG